jgi:hypothetical protein
MNVQIRVKHRQFGLRAVEKTGLSANYWSKYSVARFAVGVYGEALCRMPRSLQGIQSLAALETLDEPLETAVTMSRAI